VALGNVVPRVLRELGLTSTAAIVRLAERWESIVGSEIAAHCAPFALRGKRLEATVDSSVWCQQLQLRQSEILEALRRELGEAAPSELRFRLR
jgi:predicted nucleic acid-binding Zn ribbon protein